MALIQFIVEGFDPTILGAEDCLTAAELLQMVHEAQPAAGIGAEVESDTAPDTTTYPVFKRFTWAKTSAGARTGEEYYWNGSAWTLKVPPAGSINGSSLMDGTVALAKLIPSTAYYLMQMNAGGTAWAAVPVSSIFTTNLVPQNSIVNAAGADYIMYSGVGGVWSSVLFSTQLESTLAVIGVDIAIVKDTLGAGQVGQVVYESVADGTLGFSWVEDRLRANQTATSKINWGGAAAAGKLPLINSTGTDVTPTAVTDILGTKAAVLRATAAAGTDGQQVNSTAVTTVTLNEEVDPSGITSLSANTFVLQTGTYTFDIVIPVAKSSTALKIKAELFDGTNVVAHASARLSGDTDEMPVCVKHVASIVGATTYSIRVRFDTASVDTLLGRAVNLDGLGEVYTQVLVTKIA